MTNHIFARVELHEHADGTRPNYEVLKANMARWQFRHELWDGSNNVLLPTGTYVRTEPAPLDHALDCAKLAADITGFANCGVIMSPEGFRTFGLKVRPVGRLTHLLRAARSLEEPVPAYAPTALREMLEAKRLRP
jgi:hypothetical protein